MATRPIDRERTDEDWQGNNIAVTCPICKKVYLVSQLIHRGQRACPRCGRSAGRVDGGHDSGGSAELEWEDE